MNLFIGRHDEHKRLLELIEKKSASFIVVKGRRRIGKSRLIKEFSKSFQRCYSFIGLAPDKNTTAKHQLDEFSRQISREFKTSAAHYDDWSDAFWAVGERVLTGKVLLFFDEISWMGSKDPTFLGKIKNLWDSQLKENSQLIFVVCGSASAWIEENILSNTGFVGRISMTLTLDELPLSDCSRFWPKNISAYEKFKILSVTGGVPKYLEEINPKQSAEENIKKLCFTKGGFLVDEFEKIFSDIFARKTEYYKKILPILSNGSKEQSEICSALKVNSHGRISEYLWELELAGFIRRDYTWNIKTGQDAELSRYRLSDNYLRFYLKYIEKNLTKINRNSFELKSLISLPEWYSMMGFQFENLILNNRKSIHQSLGIYPEEIVCENPFFQRNTSRMTGCQIDYMIQTKFGTLYICEVKFSKSPIGTSVIHEVQEKIKALKFPKGFSCRPVLIHVNGVTEEVVESDYFAKIIDMSAAL
ncbi:MAG: ATP-binding protein [Bdellovibrionota bacterium]